MGCACGSLDLVGRAHEPPDLREVVHDRGVLAAVSGRRHPAREFLDARWTADVVEFSVALEVRGDREVVDRLAGAVQRAHRGEHSPVCGSVEVVVLEADVEDGVEAAFVQENGAEH